MCSSLELGVEPEPNLVIGIVMKVVTEIFISVLRHLHPLLSISAAGEA
jgi:hypothetical protein